MSEPAAGDGRTLHRVLRGAAVLEPVTLLVLLGNLATVHSTAVADVLGPLHGAVYLTVVVCLLLVEGAPTRARLLALVPGIGGLLAERRLDGARRPAS